MGNLTSVNGYRLEHETPQHFYYYTPCRNGEQCPQGNANFYGNAVQFQPGANQCQHYLSVDHHDHPDYFFGTAAWIFRYEDGEMCDSTQQPRRTNVYMLCDEFMSGGAYLYDAEEPQKCNYALSVALRWRACPRTATTQTASGSTPTRTAIPTASTCRRSRAATCTDRRAATATSSTTALARTDCTATNKRGAAR